MRTSFTDDDFKARRVLPPIPIAGRWGSVHGNGIFLRDTTPARIATVFNLTFDPEAQAKLDKAAAAASAACDDNNTNKPIDEPALDEQDAYRKKISKWTKGTLQAVNEKLWWYFVVVNNILHEPLMIFSCGYKSIHRSTDVWRNVRRERHARLLVVCAMLHFRRSSEGILPA
ncbi:unnamed protein product [Polarella glacialis]|uniref:Uncharacterized protein n=1 Tax=Polarella glacialis TaxID=89957 RepID=A0A813E301_POLGL|nr:unnamed protein product [Polarella glacialis]